MRMMISMMIGVLVIMKASISSSRREVFPGRIAPPESKSASPKFLPADGGGKSR